MQPVVATRQLDLADMREFFLGVLGWRPQDFRRTSLHDLCAAFKGFQRHHRPESAARIGKAFLAKMVQLFPDGEK